MKSIANQYRDLQEGKMSQANFMRNLRMSMPQVTNVTSFNDAVKILKNKGIIAETVIKESEVLSQAAQDENKQSKAEEIADLKAEIQALMDSGSQQDPEIVSDKIDDIRAKIEKLKAEKAESLNEAVNDSGKKEYSKFSETENDNFNELVDGITIEHECYPTKTYDEIVKMVTKNLKKDPFYYTTYKLTGIPGSKIETMDASKPETHQMKYYTGKNAVDTERGMKKVKMPKKVEEKKKLKEQVEEATMPFKDLPADPEKYKMVKDSKGKIMKATNADGVEFQRGDEVTAVDNGEKIKIVDFKEEQGKVKALYNKGMFFASIDIDGLEAPKAEFKPGVNIGGSFEKFKSKLAEMVRKAMSEMYDGRDNLDAEIEDDINEELKKPTNIYADDSEASIGTAKVKFTLVNKWNEDEYEYEGTPELDTSDIIPILTIKKSDRNYHQVFFRKQQGEFLEADTHLYYIVTPLNDVAKEWFEKLKQATKR